MEKKIINSSSVPSPIGPYSQAVRAGGFIFCSGQIAIDPDSGILKMVSIEEETRQVMSNIGKLLEASGCKFSNIVKTSIFISDMDIFPEVNEIYASYFAGNFPARETVAVKTLPKHVNVEISVTAYIAE